MHPKKKVYSHNAKEAGGAQQPAALQMFSSDFLSSITGIPATVRQIY